ncbi:hypothetical protein CPB84DRAFT_1786615 [Gymnopilus junonius]|uniref:Uncharacterized protein n=1 Tax=Gymnopilus junonius TaxID=109634 RepID=A0A9P5NIV8_GYMJU|nr:hypothetical protein CPB84DRAFT_1786615 [Gymnopilus junonius]
MEGTSVGDSQSRDNAHLIEHNLEATLPSGLQTSGVDIDTIEQLLSNLPYTTITTPHSRIHLKNGREALSFVIHVDPGYWGLKQGYNGWEVEKYYEDIAQLDWRMRESIKSDWHYYKIPELLDAKLLKDNAPVKGDQRKIVLGNYFQI